LLYFGDSEAFASDSMKASYHLIKPEDLSWRPSNLMKIPNADYLERTGSENLGARLWRLPPGAPTRCTSTSVRRSFISCWKVWAACAWGTKR
jgi:hypothetical protein